MNQFFKDRASHVVSLEENLGIGQQQALGHFICFLDSLKMDVFRHAEKF